MEICKPPNMDSCLAQVPRSAQLLIVVLLSLLLPLCESNQVYMDSWLPEIIDLTILLFICQSSELKLNGKWVLKCWYICRLWRVIFFNLCISSFVGILMNICFSFSIPSVCLFLYFLFRLNSIVLWCWDCVWGIGVWSYNGFYIEDTDKGRNGCECSPQRGCWRIYRGWHYCCSSEEYHGNGSLMSDDLDFGMMCWS